MSSPKQSWQPEPEKESCIKAESFLQIFLFFFLAWRIALETTPTAPRLQQYCSVTDFGATFHTTITQLKAGIPHLPPGPVTQFTTGTTKIKAHEQV